MKAGTFFRQLSRYGLPLITIVTYIFLYLPIVILIIYSFNNASFPSKWVGFTWRWYQELFDTPEIWYALKNSLVVATSSMILSLLFGLLFVFYGASDYVKRLLLLFLGSIALPEIVIAVGLLSFLVFFSIPLGLAALIVGHTLLGLAFVVPMLHARFILVDYTLTEASLDLGASENQTLYKIIFPILLPTLIACALLVFLLSLDDVLIAFFCADISSQTLSLYLFSMMRVGVSPVINALSTIMLLVSSLVVLILTALNIRTRVF